MKSSASKQGQGERCCPNTSAHHTHGVNNGVQGVIIPSAILKIVLRHILFSFNAV